MRRSFLSTDMTSILHPTFVEGTNFKLTTPRVKKWKRMTHRSSGRRRSKQIKRSMSRGVQNRRTDSGPSWYSVDSLPRVSRSSGLEEGVGACGWNVYHRSLCPHAEADSSACCRFSKCLLSMFNPYPFNNECTTLCASHEIQSLEHSPRRAPVRDCSTFVARDRFPRWFVVRAQPVVLDHPRLRSTHTQTSRVLTVSVEVATATDSVSLCTYTPVKA